MVSKSKNDAHITCHLPSACVKAIQNLTLDTGESCSEWLRDLAVAEINNRLLQAKSMQAALESIENDELYQSCASYPSARSVTNEL